ncbi:hypothetical protein F4801DRAFT_231714 [Xylaria longipes]|nr:hypothetical protein F4801DRAFT_231714 [Xylaria longipes]
MALSDTTVEQTKLPATTSSGSESAEVQKVDESLHGPAYDAKAEGSAGPDHYVTGFKLAALIFSVARACFLVLIDTIVISTAIPRITDEFKFVLDIGWYASAYQLGRLFRRLRYYILRLARLESLPGRKCPTPYLSSITNSF